jgi:hypothetical protein
MNAFTTPTQTLTVGADGTIDFSGFYGDYTVTINGVNYDLDLQKGTTFYTVPEPAAGGLAALAGVLVSCGRFFAKPKPRTRRR